MPNLLTPIHYSLFTIYYLLIPKTYEVYKLEC